MIRLRLDIAYDGTDFAGWARQTGINTISIDLPPLRERPEDIPALAEHFVAKYAKKYRKSVEAVSPEVMEGWKRHQWPGNVRELVNALDRALLAARFDPTLFPAHLPLDIRIEVTRTALSRKPSSSEDKFKGPSRELPKLRELRETLIAQAEKQYLRDLMALCQGDMDKACRIAELSPSRLYALLQKYNIPRTG